MSDRSSSAPPPGWYADSPQTSRLRWWNGSAWTDHYRLVDESDAAPPAPEVAEAQPAPPSSRAALRARRTDPTSVITGAGTPAQPAPAMPPEPQPQSPAQPQAPLSIAPPSFGVGYEPGRRTPPQAPTASAQTAVSIAPPSVGPGYEPGERFPDQILTRGPQVEAERIPRPLSYDPVPSIYTGDQPARLLAPSSQNGAAKTSVALVALSLVGWILAIFWLPQVDAALAGLMIMASVALAIASLLTAVAGLVVAVQRPTRKREAVIGLVLSGLILLGLATMVIWQVVLVLV